MCSRVLIAPGRLPISSGGLGLGQTIDVKQRDCLALSRRQRSDRRPHPDSQLLGCDQVDRFGSFDGRLREATALPQRVE